MVEQLIVENIEAKPYLPNWHREAAEETRACWAEHVAILWHKGKENQPLLTTCYVAGSIGTFAQIV